MADRKLAEVRTQFVESVNDSLIKQLLDDLLEKGVLNEEEVDEVKEGRRKQDQARTLIDNTRRKGQTASQIFIECVQCRSTHLTELLGLKDYSCGHGPPPPLPTGLASAWRARDRPEPSPGCSAPEPPVSSQELKLCPLDLCRKIRAQEAEEIYPMILSSPTRTRLALIICNLDFQCLRKRDGAEVDLEEMRLLLEGLGYTVQVETNSTSQEMADAMKRFAVREEHRNSDSTFLVLMSHGVREGLCGVQSQGPGSDILPLDSIFATFNNKNCQYLRGKPKVILIQACRGENEGYVWVSDSGAPPAAPQNVALQPPDEFESDAICKTHIERDFICLYSTTPDHLSWRRPKTGSLFIVEVRKQIKGHAWNCNLEEVFRKVLQAFEQNPRQMPTKERTTLTRKLYLFPGC